MLQAAANLNLDLNLEQKSSCQFLLPVASTIDLAWIKDEIAAHESAVNKRLTGFAVLPRIVLVDDARTALFHARARVVASGTATVQALTIGTPFVVVYRVSALTFALARRMIRYPAEIPSEPDADGHLPVAMVNLIAGKRIVPELLNRRFTAANVIAALRPLLDETPERREMIAALTEAREGCCPRPAKTQSVASPMPSRSCCIHPVLTRSEAPPAASNLLGLNKRLTSGACIQLHHHACGSITVRVMNAT